MTEQVISLISIQIIADSVSLDISFSKVMLTAAVVLIWASLRAR